MLLHSKGCSTFVRRWLGQVMRFRKQPLWYNCVHAVRMSHKQLKIPPSRNLKLSSTLTDIQTKKKTREFCFQSSCKSCTSEIKELLRVKALSWQCLVWVFISCRKFSRNFHAGHLFSRSALHASWDRFTPMASPIATLYPCAARRLRPR